MPDLDFEARLVVSLRAFAEAGLRPLDAHALAEAVALSRPRGRSFRPLLFGAARSRRWSGTLLAVALLVALLAMTALLVGSRQRTPPHNPLVFEQGGRLVALDVDDRSQVDLGSGTNPAWSPDRSRLVFNRDDGLWIMAADGTEVRRIGPFTDGSPAWAPDGSAVLVGYYGAAATPSVGGVVAPLFRVIPIDGGTPRDLGRRPWKDAGNGSWAPDGKHIALVDGPNFLTVLDLSREPVIPSWVLPAHLPWQLEWSPDGSSLAYSADGAIRLVQADGTGDRVLLQVVDPTGRDVAMEPYALNWAPDGRTIAYALLPAPGASAAAYVLDRSTGRTSIVLSPPAGLKVSGIAWSADGTRLAIAVVTVDANCGVDPITGSMKPGPAPSLWIVNSDGTSPRHVVTLDQGGCPGGFDW